MAALGFAGMSVAQDIYTSGYFTSNSRHQPAVYKNGSRLYWNDGFTSKNGESTDVLFNNGDVYWVKNCINTDGTYHYGDIMKNNGTYLDSPTEQGYHINDLFLGHPSSYSSNDLHAAGCRNIGGVKTAVVFLNESTTPYLTLGNGTWPSEAYAGTTIYIPGTGYWTISAGVQYTSSTAYKGVVWKASSEQASVPNAKFFDIASYDGTLYVVGAVTEGGATKLKVWSMGYEGTSLSVVYTLVNSGAGSRAKIVIDAGDIYVCSYGGTNDDILWKNGTQLYSTGGYFQALAANSNGVYAAGSQGGAGKVWKDGSVVYSPSNCDMLRGMFVAEPECTDSDVRSLPFSDSFENGNTSWPCWTKLDVDGSNETRPSYWMRGGKREATPATGDYCARHTYGASSAGNQEGWLISPRLFLQPGRDNTTLTFKTSEGASDDYVYEGVWVSTNSNPATTSAYTEVWTQSNPSNSWKTVTVDLKDYQGQAVYIAFKYTGTYAHTWYIDDVTVTESWNPCSTQSVPYTQTFQNWEWQSTCWYNVDFDMSGGSKHWKYSESEQCAYHPWGQSGVEQYGCLVSPNITLESGKDYVLKFKTKSTSSGSNMANKIWIKLDGTGIPDPDAYTTFLWSDNQFASSWVDVEVPLTAYAGHTISFSFEYHGTYAHNWYLKDVRVEQAIAQYTITANVNNNAWGTVSGGGTYNAGATCTLTATPTSGYNFESWKKNGTVVSTNPSYTFTVNESATYTAYFAETPVTYYTISTNVTPAGAGTVAGGGSYEAGSSVTLTATPNTGYSFSQWQDGNTQNPRTITVSGDATYTATFTQDPYTVSVYANPTNGGTVSGGGNYHYGDNATLTATANSGFEFQGWSDGSTDNPHVVTVTGNATYTATFGEVGSTYFTVTTDVTPEGAGVVTGGGTYEAGTEILLKATANPGYTFERWSDGNTSNPRPVTVNYDMSFTAEFSAIQYTITVVANPVNGGSVSGGGAYYYGDNAVLRAIAYSGYEFVGWSDGSPESQHTVTVTGNATYTATFVESGTTTYYTVTAYASPTNSGKVDGTGVYAAGTAATLTAIPLDGYTFDHWNDGNKQNPRTVTVNNNMSFTAYFATNQCTITTAVSPAGAGSVSGGGTYAYGSQAVLTATANEGYQFLQWNDGNKQNPRTITVSGDATYTALFSSGLGVMFTVTLTVNDPSLGHVFGGGSYPSGTSIEIAAYPNAGARFVKWSDGNTNNPRTLQVNNSIELEAEFAAQQSYAITVESADPNMGQAYGSGNYEAGETVEISAVAYNGYVFERWNDGNTQNPRSITVTGNATYTAHFKASGVTTYNLTLICNTSEGTVSGGGTYVAGSSAFIQVFPYEGYMFDKWSDGSTDNPREVIMTSDLTLVAFFKVAGVGDNEQPMMVVYPNPAKESIRILGIEANSQVEIFNSLGELVRTVSANPEQEIGIRDLAEGLYLVRCGKATLRFVKTH